MICPCCGREVTPNDRLKAFVAKNSGGTVKGGVLNALMAARAPMSLKDLVGVVYAHDPNGGPMGADQCIRICISRLRPGLNAIGWTIQHYGWSGYTLQPIKVAA
jgi:hypothetical protein